MQTIRGSPIYVYLSLAFKKSFSPTNIPPTSIQWLVVGTIIFLFPLSIMSTSWSVNFNLNRHYFDQDSATWSRYHPHYWSTFIHKTSTSIISSIEFIFKCLFLSYEDVRKIYWLKWNKVCLDMEKGGWRFMEFRSLIWHF